MSIILCSSFIFGLYFSVDEHDAILKYIPKINTIPYSKKLSLSSTISFCFSQIGRCQISF